MISIFVEFIDQLIDYPINCAALGIRVIFFRFFFVPYPKCVQWRFCSDGAFAQSDLNLRLAHMSEGTFSDVVAHLPLIFGPMQTQNRPGRTWLLIRNYTVCHSPSSFSAPCSGWKTSPLYFTLVCFMMLFHCCCFFTVVVVVVVVFILFILCFCHHLFHTGMF